jgi:hypothetical protein
MSRGLGRCNFRFLIGHPKSGDGAREALGVRRFVGDGWPPHPHESGAPGSGLTRVALEPGLDAVADVTTV